MVCGHYDAPYSVSEKFKSIFDPYLLSGSTAEIRLFAILPRFRGRRHLAIRLASYLLKHFFTLGIKNCVISGIESQRKFYEHVGFTVIGEVVKDGNALFYPMEAPIEKLLFNHQEAQKFANKI